MSWKGGHYTLSEGLVGKEELQSLLQKKHSAKTVERSIIAARDSADKMDRHAMG
jgi:hypothetical protein